MSDRTPITIPKAPQGWKLNPDQQARVAQDPRLHRLSPDELYIYFNPPKKPAQSGNVLLDYANRAANYVGLPEDWLMQMFAWHPANTMDKTSSTLREVNDRRRR